MTSPSFDFLSANLSEIYAALYDPTATDSLPLTTWGNRIFYTGSWLGKMIHFWRKEDPERELPKLRAALIYTINDVFDRSVRHTHLAYNQYVIHFVRLIRHAPDTEPLEPVINRYQNYLLSSLDDIDPETTLKPYVSYAQECLSAGKALSDGSIRKMRQQLVTCSLVTEGFWRLFNETKNSQNGRMVNLIKEVFADQRAVLFNQKLYQGLRQAQSLINIEGVLREPIPILALSQIMQHPLDAFAIQLERLQIQGWVNRLNRWRSEIRVEEFLDALTEIAHILNIERSEPVNVDLMILKLSALNCEILTQVDQHHLQWRRGLKPGMEVECNEKTVILGEQISPKKIGDHYQIFAIQDDPTHVIKIGRNCAELKIEKAKCEWEHMHLQALDQGDWHVKMIELDKQGRCAILERMEVPLHQYPWKSYYKNLDPKERKMILQLTKRLNSLCHAKAIPQHLSPRQFMVDFEGNIKSLRPLEVISEFDYNQLEAFCIEISQGNRFIKEALMRTAGLTEHPVAKFYREALLNLFREGSTQEWQLLQPMGYENPLYDQHLQQLSEEALKLKERCFEMIKTYLQMQQRHDNEEDHKLQKKVQEVLIRAYQRSSTPGRLNIDGGIEFGISKLTELEVDVLAEFIFEDEKPTKKESPLKSMAKRIPLLGSLLG